MRETHEAGMTAEQRVKAKWPEAMAETPVGWTTFVYVGKTLRLLGIGGTKDAAWADAASRLED